MEERERAVRSADGTTIGVFVTGSGPPLVLVHGSTADHTRFRPVLDALSARFTCYAVDRRGRGASGDTEPYAIEREFEDIAAVCDHIDEPVNLFGHSYGAVCSLEASLRSSNLATLTVYEPPLPIGITIATPAVLDRMRALLDAGEREEALVLFFRELPKVPEPVIEMMRTLPAWQARVAAAHTVLREAAVEHTYAPDFERFRAVSVPTLLMVGSESPPFLTQPIALLEKTIPGARVCVLEGQEHTAIDTASELFARELLAFLDR